MASRIHSIDAMRTVAIVFVVLIHTDPFQGLGASGNALNFGIKTTARFAVPFFFLASGYFFALKTTRRNLTEYVSKRVVTLSSLYLFGLVLAAPTFFAGRLARGTLEGRSMRATAFGSLADYVDVVELLYYGTSVSEILWFLPALLFSLVFVSLFILTGRPGYALPVALSFHVVGLLGANYTMFVDVPFNVRDGLFFGFFYTSVGYTVGEYGWEPARRHSRLLLALVGCFALLQLVEFYAIGYPLRGEPFGSYVYAPSYGVSTALLSTSLFLFLLSRPALGADTPLPSWGVYTVGIYVTHPAVFAALRGLRDTLVSLGYTTEAALVWHLVLTPATLLGAFAVYLLAHRLRVIEIGGSHIPGEPWLRARRSE